MFSTTTELLIANKVTWKLMLVVFLAAAVQELSSSQWTDYSQWMNVHGYSDTITANCCKIRPGAQFTNVFRKIPKFSLISS